MGFLAFLVWMGASLAIGSWAGQTGRSGFGWFTLSLLFSPLLIGIVLFISSQGDEEKKEVILKKEKELNELLKIKGHEFALNLENAYQLFKEGIFSEQEFTTRKDNLIDDLDSRVIDGPPETFLSELLKLKKEGILTKEDLEKIKDIVFKESVWDIEQIG